MGLYEQIRDIAKSKGYSINRLEKELGFARSSINKFNKNVPSVEKLQQIADLLNVSLDSLLSGKEESMQKEITLTAKDERDIKKDLDSIMSKIESGQEGPASYDGEPLSPESTELFRDALELALRQIKILNKSKYNPHKNKK